MSCHQYAGQSTNRKIVNKFFKCVVWHNNQNIALCNPKTVGCYQEPRTVNKLFHHAVSSNWKHC